MKAINIPKIERLPELTFEHSDTINRACYFILTRLALAGTGAIFAEWTRGINSVAWKFVDDRTFMFEAPKNAPEILRVPSLAVFRSMLARLGFASTGETYLGAGIFDIYFEPGKPLDTRFAIVFSNEKQTGYWIKLQTVARFKPESTP